MRIYLPGNKAKFTEAARLSACFHPISPSKPVKTSFQEDIQIYEDKLDQSGDRILSSHITMVLTVSHICGLINLTFSLLVTTCVVC